MRSENTSSCREAVSPLDRTALEQLFLNARSHNAWTDRPVTDEDVRSLYELAKWGPTSTNSNPARFVFLRTAESRERLVPHVHETNVAKITAAPCCVIIAFDAHFYDLMPELFPSRDLRSYYAGKTDLIEETAFRNSTLQGAYLMLAARALGFDVGALSGFDRAAVDREFFPGGRWRSNFLCNIGYGRHDLLFPRNPRLPFEKACIEL